MNNIRAIEFDLYGTLYDVHSVSHMGAHALGAADYAAKALRLARPEAGDAVDAELRWQVRRLSPMLRAALGSLPMIGSNRSGPLGPGLLASGDLGACIRRLQLVITGADGMGAEER